MPPTLWNQAPGMLLRSCWFPGAAEASSFGEASVVPLSYIRAGLISQRLSGVNSRPDEARHLSGCGNGGNKMKIKLTTLHVDDQEKALRFYTEALGFSKRTDVSQGPYRWLTVGSPDEPEGVELQLALNDNPAAKEYQQALFQQGHPAAMFFTDDVKADYERIKARGAEFTMTPTKVTGSTIAQLNDSVGNLIQLTELDRY